MVIAFSVLAGFSIAGVLVLGIIRFWQGRAAHRRSKLLVEAMRSEECGAEQQPESPRIA